MTLPQAKQGFRPDVICEFPYMSKNPMHRGYCVHCPINASDGQWTGSTKEEVVTKAREHLRLVHKIADPTYA